MVNIVVSLLHVGAGIRASVNSGAKKSPTCFLHVGLLA